MGSVRHTGFVEEVVIGCVYVGGSCDVTRWEGCPGSGSVHCGEIRPPRQDHCLYCWRRGLQNVKDVG